LIENTRTDERIDFVGGIRGSLGVEEKCKSRNWSLGFLLYPISIETLMEVSDNNKLLPPKTTWFEPKLLSGLVVRSLSTKISPVC
jgi:uncharacterized protein (DUF1015 family)